MPYRGIRSLARITRLVSFIALILSLLIPAASLFGETPAKNVRKVVVRVEPEFPDFFRNGHFQGRVVAEATVLPNGNVASVDVKAGNPMFAEFASKALMKWKYAPAPEKTVEQVTFNFTSSPQ
jgi:outer membrane biosynthesis protein TonB